MYFYNLMKEISQDKKVQLFLDMDGVIASYDFGKPLNFKKKRPLTRNIKVLEKVSKLENIECSILSICHKDSEIDDKNHWLDLYAPFFKVENRFILSKESIANKSSSEMKKDFLKKLNTKKQMVLVDDDNQILKLLSKELKNVILLQDSELID